MVVLSEVLFFQRKLSGSQQLVWANGPEYFREPGSLCFQTSGIFTPQWFDPLYH